jgi:hypothetical protein
MGQRGGGGCVGLVFGLVVLGLIVQYWYVALGTVVLIGVVAALVHWMSRALEREAERRGCAVCTGWSGSVLLTELDSARRDRLCGQHDAVLRRIEALEHVLAD